MTVTQCEKAFLEQIFELEVIPSIRCEAEEGKIIL
jgi:hypothetical protein